MLVVRDINFAVYAQINSNKLFFLFQFSHSSGHLNFYGFQDVIEGIKKKQLKDKENTNWI